MEALNSAMTFDNVLYGLKKAPQANAADLKKEKDMAKIEKTAEDFEAFFITKMMESMFEGISTDGMFGGGHAEKFTAPCFWTNTAKQWPKPEASALKTKLCVLF